LKEINLLPKEYIKQRKSKSGKYIRIAISIAVLSFVILLGIGIKTRLNDLEAKFVTVDETYTEVLSPLLEEKQSLEMLISNIDEKYNLYQELLEERVLWTEIILEITEAVPENVQIDNLLLSDKENILISGKTTSASTLAQFIVRLNNSPYIDDVDLRFITTSPDPRQKGIRETNYQLILSLFEKSNTRIKGGEQND